MKIKFYASALLAFLLLTGIANGQDGNNVSYHLSNLPQRVRLNPAYQPEYGVWVGLPVLSGVSVNYLNSSFAVKDLIRKKNNGTDSLVFDFDRMYQKLRKHNFIGLTNENSLLTVGVRLKNNWYLTVDATQKNEMLFGIDKGFFTFLKNGNAPYIGQNFSLGGIGLTARAYEEFAVGLSKKVNEKWTFGARAKFLLGVANAQLTKSEVNIDGSGSVQSGPGQTLRLHSKQEIRLTAPVTLSYTLQEGGYLDWDNIDTDTDDFSSSMVLNSDNPGFALDLGAEYQFNERLKLHASLTDLGFIRWGGAGYRFGQDTTFDWRGADASNSGNKNDANYTPLEDVFEDLVDTLKNCFRLKEQSGAYTTLLRSKMYLGASYDLHKLVSVGGLVEMTLMNKTLYPSLTASANARFHRNVSASVAYTVMPGNYVNLGVGITAKLGPVQLYAATDNALGANYTSAKSTSARFGVNLLFGHKDKKKKATSEEILETIVVPVKKQEVAPPDTVPEPETMKAIEEFFEPETRETDVLLPNVQEETVIGAGEISKPYHVILGSFQNKLRADKLRERLVKMGFNDSVIMQNEQGLHRVSAIAYHTREEAWEKVFDIRDKYSQFYDAWALKVN
ncbi:MAG: DUF5723 family protein [Culturomica sp.]|jgi:cell division septation protein DedD|nr:DUF5723 family protein [Culturomica sp.]